MKSDERAAGPTLDDAGEGTHPDLEDLAALMDGRLAAESSAAIRQHISRCDDCYEVFSEALHLLQEAEPQGEPEPRQTPIPFPARIHRRWAVVAALVAAAALALGGGEILYRLFSSPAAFRVDQISATLGLTQGAKSPWTGDSRGETGGERVPQTAWSFRLGVELVNLQVSLDADDGVRAADAAAQINILLDTLHAMPQTTKDFYIRLADRKPTAGHRARDSAPQAAKLADLAFAGTVEEPYFELGKWSEAGWLAASTRRSNLFRIDNVERFPASVERRFGKELGPETVTELRRIDEILRRDNLRQQDFDRLGQLFSSILQRYYPV